MDKYTKAVLTVIALAPMGSFANSFSDLRNERCEALKSQHPAHRQSVDLATEAAIEARDYFSEMKQRYRAGEATLEERNDASKNLRQSMELFENATKMTDEWLLKTIQICGTQS